MPNCTLHGTCARFVRKVASTEGLNSSEWVLLVDSVLSVPYSSVHDFGLLVLVHPVEKLIFGLFPMLPAPELGEILDIDGAVWIVMLSDQTKQPSLVSYHVLPAWFTILLTSVIVPV